MATRYSGDVTVRIVYVDSGSHYCARVTSPDGARVVMVRPAPASRLAVDSSAAYDEAARAAIAFAEHEGLAVQPAYTDSGIQVRRSPHV